MVEGWKRTELKELLETLESGLRPKGGASEDSGEIPSLGGENILQLGGVDVASVKKIPKEFYKKLVRGKLKYLDVLINKDGANTGKVGLYRIKSFKDAAINEHLFLLRGKGVTQEYLYYYLLSQSAQRIIKNKISGSAQPGLNTTFVKDFFLELPERVDEQENISAILIKIDEAIENTKVLIKKNKLIKAGLMQDLFTNGIDEKGNIRSEKTHKFKDSPLGRIPENWEHFSFEDLIKNKTISDIQDGNHGEKHPKSSDFVDEGIPFVMASDIGDNFLNLVSCKKITKNQYKQLRIGFARPRDVLLSHKASIGFTAIVPEDLEEIMLTPQVTYYRIKDKSKLSPEFLYYIFQTDFFQNQIKNFAKQSTRDYIGILAQRKLELYFPKDIEEQIKIVEIISKFDENIKQKIKKLLKLQSLKQGLMQDLLTGKVRVTLLMKEAVA